MSILDADFYIFYCLDLDTQIGWDAIDENDNNYIIASGFVIKESKINYYIASDLDPENEHVNRTMKLPKATIISKFKVPGVKKYVRSKFK